MKREAFSENAGRFTVPRRSVMETRGRFIVNRVAVTPGTVTGSWPAFFGKLALE